MFTVTRAVTARLLIMVKHTATFLLELQTIWVYCNRKKNVLTISSVKQSTVSDHLVECNCLIGFDHFDILATDASNFRLLVKESLLIKSDQPYLNKTIKSFPLKLFD